MPKLLNCLIISGQRARTRAALDDNAARAASGLAATGIREGDAVALLLRNDFAFLEAQIAAQLIGAFTVPINWHSTVDELTYLLGDCGARVLIAHADLVAPIIGELPAEMPVFVVATPAEISTAFHVTAVQGHIPSGATDWDRWVSTYPPMSRSDAKRVPPIIYTSGSTGRPKGVLRDGASGGSTKALRVYGLDRPGPIRALVTGPLYHSVPNAFARLALETGADIVFEPRFEPDALLASVERHLITHLHIVPAMMVRLLRLPQEARARHNLSSLRYVVHGAAPCPRAVKSEMIDWLGPILHEYYGSTETGLLTFADTQAFRDKPGTVGQPLPGITLKILDKNGAELPTGAVGAVYASSSHLRNFSYLGEKGQQNTTDAGGLMTVGDIGRLDPDGYLYLVGRESDLIQTNGQELACADVEAAILRCEDVRDCAVIGVPDRAFGEIVCAFVELSSTDFDACNLTQLVRGTLGLPKLVLRIEILDRLPREDSGKIFKRALKERFVDHASNGPERPSIEELEP